MIKKATARKAPKPKFMPLMPDLVKVSATGKLLPETAKKWAAVYDKVTGLLFPAELPKDSGAWSGVEAVAKIKLCGKYQCRAANDREAQWIVDRRFRAPAFNPKFFRFPPSGWIWTTTALAGASSHAWGMLLGGGAAGAWNVNDGGLSLPVCGPLVLPGQ